MPASELLEIDQWILVETEELVRKCRAWYDEFAFHKVYRAVYDFATMDLSAVYFDVLKDRLYTSAPQSKARRSAQTALYRINLRAGASAGAAADLHGRRSLGSHAAAGRTRRTACT